MVIQIKIIFKGKFKNSFRIFLLPMCFQFPLILLKVLKFKFNFKNGMVNSYIMSHSHNTQRALKKFCKYNFRPHLYQRGRQHLSSFLPSIHVLFANFFKMTICLTLWLWSNIDLNSVWIKEIKILTKIR